MQVGWELRGEAALLTPHELPCSSTVPCGPRCTLC